jgi:hypothetical protein
MKIQILQPKLIEILDYLYVDGLFPFSVITTKDGSLYSSQSDKEGFAYRYAAFLGDYFKSITKEQESIKIDIEKIKKFASIRKPESIITLEYPSTNENKLKISSEHAKDSISVTKLDPSEIKQGLPFDIKEGTPYINKGKIALDTHATVSLASFKTINDYATAHGTEFFKFKIGKDRKLEVRIGDIHALDDYTTYSPNAQVTKVQGEIEVTFTKGIKELAKTFTRDIEIHLRSNMPAWFSEISQSHRFGVLLSPLKEA